MNTLIQSKNNQTDMHRADIVANLHKRGWSLRRLSLHHGYSSPNTLKNALDRPWPKAEKIISDALGVKPKDIWPSRYKDNNNSLSN